MIYKTRALRLLLKHPVVDGMVPGDHHNVQAPVIPIHEVSLVVSSSGSRIVPTILHGPIGGRRHRLDIRNVTSPKRSFFLFVNMNIALRKGNGDALSIERFFDIFRSLENDVPYIR